MITLNSTLFIVGILKLTVVGSLFSIPTSSNSNNSYTVSVKKKKKKKNQEDTSTPPSKYFDLSDWSLSEPTDRDGNGRSDHIYENDLNNGHRSEFFYASKDSGMVFKCPIQGYKTSKNTSYTRTELREMLRVGNKKIKTKGPNKNNWVFKGSPNMDTAGGYDGHLKATLAVNHVTRSGSPKQVGRVIIGQIHAEDDEPLRLYYRKLPQNKKGAVYFAHENRNTGEDIYYDLIGSRKDNADDPNDGIALNEKFSYEVLVVDTYLSIKINRPNKIAIQKVINMKDSGYAVEGEYMYFKAGVYNQNKTGRPMDYTQATFYNLENSHKVL